MSTQIEKRPYRKKKRAELEAETRRRITESAVELHGTVGPARTTMSAVAEKAGVRRSTLYRHFPDDDALFAACSAHWAAENPLPDIGAWAEIGDPDARLRAGLEELYRFYRRTRGMMENLLRDEDTVPAVKKPFSAYRDYLDAAVAILLGGRGRKETRAAVGHALAFQTWRSLAVEHGLEDGKAADLMCRLVADVRR